MPIPETTSAESFACFVGGKVLRVGEGKAWRELVSAGYKVLAVRCAVSDDAQVAAMADRTVAEFGRLDAAFKNGGVMARIAPTASRRYSRQTVRVTASCHGRIT